MRFSVAIVAVQYSRDGPGFCRRSSCARTPVSYSGCCGLNSRLRLHFVGMIIRSRVRRSSLGRSSFTEPCHRGRRYAGEAQANVRALGMGEVAGLRPVSGTIMRGWPIGLGTGPPPQSEGFDYPTPLHSRPFSQVVRHLFCKQEIRQFNSDSGHHSRGTRRAQASFARKLRRVQVPGTPPPPR